MSLICLKLGGERCRFGTWWHLICFVIDGKLQAQKTHTSMEPKDLEDENEGNPPSSSYELHKSMNVNSNKKTFRASSLHSCVTHITKNVVGNGCYNP